MEHVETWTHVKTGGQYIVLGHGFIESGRVDAVIYQSLAEDETVWVRPEAEFYDGRFVKNGPR